MASVLARIADAIRHPAPAQSIAVRDSGVVNMQTGLGTTVDASIYDRHSFRPLHPFEIEQSYRASWLMRKLIDLPAREQVRARRNWQTDKANIAKLEAEEKRLSLWEKIKTAEIMRGLGGGAIIVWIEGDDPATPLDPAAIRAQGITTLLVKPRWDFQLGEIIFDLSNPWHGHPSYYQIVNMSLVRESPILGLSTVDLKFHPSRVVAFKGEEVPLVGAYSWIDHFWGDSRVQVALNAVMNSDVSQASFAGMIKDAVNVIIGIPGLTEKFTTTTEIEAFQNARMTAVNAAKSIWRAVVKDNGKGGANAEGSETVEYRQMNWAGIPDVMMSFVYMVAASGNMPATVLLGKSPDGMNATGAGDLDVWEREIDGRREVSLRPCMERLDAMLIPSALGKPDDTIWWEFGPLSTMSETEQATAFWNTMQAMEILQNTQSMPDEAYSRIMQNLLEEKGWTPGAADILSEYPPDERFPAQANDNPEIGADGQPVDPNAITQPQAKGGDRVSPTAAGRAGAPARRAVNDARFTDAEPKTLYVSRALLNTDDLIAWAKAQGFTTTVPVDQMHVTIAYSRTPVDWMTVGTDWSGDDKGNLLVRPGGPRTMERMGDGDAVALQFLDDSLAWRHQRICDAGASWDWPTYQPHVTISWDVPAEFDLSKVEPYQGPLKFGPELFAEVVENWAAGFTEE